MSASRWHSGFIEPFDWLQENDSSIDELFLPSILTHLQKKDEKNNDSTKNVNPDDIVSKMPDVIPILPLRGVVVFPQTAVPLTIGQPRSIRLVDDVSITTDKLVGLIAARDPELENPGPADLYQTGTIATVHRLFRAPDNTIRLLVQGIMRFRLVEVISDEPYLQARVEIAPEIVETGLEIDALARTARDQFDQISQLTPSIPRELIASILQLDDPLQTVYTIANFQRIELKDAQRILELDSTRSKLEKLVDLLVREAEVLQLGAKIQNEARSGIEQVQREYFLREQMKAIQKELGEKDEQTVEVDEFRKKIESSRMPDEADKMARRELDRLARLPTSSAEYGVIRTYLDWLVSVPWSQATSDNLDISHARQVLNQDHYGLDDVKERILEFLAIRKLRLERKDDKREGAIDYIRREREGVILCFIGPPGVGKTSLGQSIARAMERKFIRASLGGVKDEAEIRGHRRTYIGAMPGRILQSLRRVETRNPVFMLDEIDKLTFDFHGDPASALLEVLDPEQNVEFRDNYLEVAYDLSQVFFITTANQVESIPDPLLDRMEIIRLSGYTENEKIAIAKGYLIPRQLRENSLRNAEISFTKPALKTIINTYTRESGVRNLERKIGAVCRKVGTRIAEGNQGKTQITPPLVREFLGHPTYRGTEEIDARVSIPGVVPGLAWTPFGGDILFIEATSMDGAKGFQVTGSVGNVMQESARAALSYVRSHTKDIGIPTDFFEKTDIHLHIPAGAQPKDGPSAGVTIATALVSLVSGKAIKRGTSMTGEITLRGQVMPVGGIKEKILAAHRAGIKTVILPTLNEPDLEDIPEEITRKMTFVFAATVNDVLNAALETKARSNHNRMAVSQGTNNA
jgi:ATP-dependent Lon protease